MSRFLSNPRPAFRYLSAWFCPFAHRATIALEHHRDRLSYEWIEALGWEKRPNADGKTGTAHEWWYHWKSDELRKHNPSALVPTLIDQTGRCPFVQKPVQYGSYSYFFQRGV